MANQILCRENEWPDRTREGLSQSDSIGAGNVDVMSQENIDRFREIVLREPGLLAAFRNRSVGSFVDFAVALGQERGCEFTADEVEKELRRWRRLWIERSL